MNLKTELFSHIREATELLQSGGPSAATAAIQRALGGLQPAPAETSHRPSSWSIPPQRMTTAHEPFNPSSFTRQGGVLPEVSEGMRNFGKSFRGMHAGWDTDVTDVEILEESPGGGDGKFITGSYANSAGKRAYKLYIPSTYTGSTGQSLPLIVMLHGCQQNPDDFAAGTQMNRVAEENSCLVLYPAQANNANGSNCWNWFQPGDQQRDRGEPSIIAGMTREIMRSHHVDPSRVYVAGLSAGGAMAAVLGAAYQDLYAAIGIHSGLPHGAAHDMPSAFAAMKQGTPANASRRSAAPSKTMPAIVFHGDRDQTVHPCNGEQATAQCLAPSRAGSDAIIEKGKVAGGHAYTKVIRKDDSGNVVSEHWTVHGAGHAWAGGSRRGSYTDAKGPDASKEMMRFFMTHVKP